MSSQSATQVVLATFSSKHQAETGIHELSVFGFDINNLTLVCMGPFVECHVAGYYTLRQRLWEWSIWGTGFGLLVGLIVLLTPSIWDSQTTQYSLGSIDAARLLFDAGMLGLGIGLAAAWGRHTAGHASRLKYVCSRQPRTYVLKYTGSLEEAEEAQAILRTRLKVRLEGSLFFLSLDRVCQESILLDLR